MNPKRTDKSNRDVSEFPELWADDDLVSVWDIVAVFDDPKEMTGLPYYWMAARRLDDVYQNGKSGLDLEIVERTVPGYLFERKKEV